MASAASTTESSTPASRGRRSGNARPSSQAFQLRTSIGATTIANSGTLRRAPMTR